MVNNIYFKGFRFYDNRGRMGACVVVMPTACHVGAGGFQLWYIFRFQK